MPRWKQRHAGPLVTTWEGSWAINVPHKSGLADHHFTGPAHHHARFVLTILLHDLRLHGLNGPRHIVLRLAVLRPEFNRLPRRLWYDDGRLTFPVLTQINNLMLHRNMLC